MNALMYVVIFFLGISANLYIPKVVCMSSITVMGRWCDDWVFWSQITTSQIHIDSQWAYSMAKPFVIISTICVLFFLQLISKLCIMILITRFMGPSQGLSGADRTQVGPMWATGTLLSVEFLICFDPSAHRRWCDYKKMFFLLPSIYDWLFQQVEAGTNGYSFAQDISNVFSSMKTFYWSRAVMSYDITKPQRVYIL